MPVDPVGSGEMGGDSDYCNSLIPRMKYMAAVDEEGESPSLPRQEQEPHCGGGEEEADREGREVCWVGCGRPSSVCLCPHLPPSPIPTVTRVLILHHPHQLRRNPLATVPILTRSVRDCHALPGRRLRPGSSPLLDHRPSSSPALFLFPGAGATDLAEWAAETPPSERADPLLVVFDGTWRHAREMVAASMPFLSGFAMRVQLGRCDEREEGDSTFESELVLRKEPFKGCVSTMEAVARALRVLEPSDRGAEVEERLLSVLRAVVGFQARHMKPVKPRPRLKKKKTKKKAMEEGEEQGDGSIADDLFDRITEPSALQ